MYGAWKKLAAATVCIAFRLLPEVAVCAVLFGIRRLFDVIQRLSLRFARLNFLLAKSRQVIAREAGTISRRRSIARGRGVATSAATG
jgi:hypothetical protein